jgi:hypothetical protein
MPENTKPRPAVILLELYEKIGGWIVLPLFFFILPVLASIAALALGFDVLSGAVQLYLSMGLELVAFVALAVIFHRYLGKSFRQARNFPGRFFIAVAAGVAIYYIGTAIMGFLTQLIEPGLENINNNTIGALADVNTPLMLVYTILLAPLVEELLFRGLIFTSLRPHSRFWAYAVSMIAFSLIHVMGYVGQYPLHILALCFVQYLPASFALAWAMEYSGSIWASICVHMIANTIAMAVLLLAG